MMAKGQKGRGNRVERKTIEKNRRMHMKGLCFKLASLVPRSMVPAAATLPKEEPTQLDQLDLATAYIKELQARIDELERRKQAALGGGREAAGVVVSSSNGSCTTDGAGNGQEHGRHPSQPQNEPLPLVDVRVVDTVLEIVLVSPAHSGNSFTLFYKVMGALEEHGAKVANAGFSVVKDKIFCTIHAQAALPEESMEQVSVAVTERLTKLLC